ncbi:MAG: TolC family protein [Eudoraea sp.]|nr:TolC family protein [Eudoraea sp.]
MNRILIFLVMLIIIPLNAQQIDSDVLGFREYLGYVKKYHPIVRQAQLQIDVGQANLMKARGGFDPKIEVDYDRKKFKGTEYYDRLNATFKVPTWYGIELKGNFEQNQGDFINPDEIVPSDGLYSAGVSFSLGNGFWINQRMATLKQAKFLRERTKADRDLEVNQVLYEASLAYFNWLRAYKDNSIYQNFFINARTRFIGIKRSAEAGDLANIDTVEAKIAMQNRELGLEQAKVALMKRRLELSNFLWLDANIPVELQDNVIPNTGLDGEVDISLEINDKPLDSFTLENHPKIKSQEFKIEGLVVDKRLKSNRLLPVIDLEYNFLTTQPEILRSFESQEYKGGINFRFPLFLRKERGDLKLAKYKLREAEYEFDNIQLEIRNKVTAIYRELGSFETQNQLIENIVADYSTLLGAEERKFSFGESSLFLVNSRESKLIDAKLKQNELQNKYFSTKASLFRSLAINPENL